MRSAARSWRRAGWRPRRASRSRSSSARANRPWRRARSACCTPSPGSSPRVSGRTPPATDTAPLSIAHAIAIERDRLTRELTDHFAQRPGDDPRSSCATMRRRTPRSASIGPATEASRALADLRERRTLWQQARRVDEAFAVVESEIGEFARTAGVRLECTLAGPPAAGGRRHRARGRVLDHPRGRAERASSMRRPRGRASRGR